MCAWFDTLATSDLYVASASPSEGAESVATTAFYRDLEVRVLIPVFRLFKAKVDSNPNVTE